jgi:hypothetical protein
VGGSGGAAGNAGNVTLNNSGKVTTYANESPALLGSSIGGGGGDAGYVLAGTGVLDEPDQIGLGASVAIGRSGGGGGKGGIVNVTNTSATLQTSGADSDAIHARSEGGGGGDAGAVLAFTATTLQDGIGVNVAVGGSGGSGSSASDVTVENSGKLITAGKNSTKASAAAVATAPLFSAPTPRLGPTKAMRPTSRSAAMRLGKQSRDRQGHFGRPDHNCGR